MSSFLFSRRTFFVLAIVGAASACVNLLASGPKAARLRGFLRDPVGAVLLGVMVDRGELGGSPGDVIAPAGEDAATWFENVDDAGFAAHVRALAIADHREGRTVDVGGWILARTEAALCALAADVFLL